jgi:hypothetical protein
MERTLPASALALALGLALAAPAAASELSDFNAAVDAAMDHRRAALFYLRTENPMVAEIELESADERWAAVVARWGETPPDAFADEADWAGELAAVGAALETAQQAAAGGDAKAAAAALEPVGPRLSRLRAEAGVIVFADRVAEANRAMDALWVYRREPIDWADAAQVDDLRARTAVTAYLYGKLKETAAADIAEDPEFARLVDGTLDALGLMWGAIDMQEETAVINILREIRSFDDLLWLRFG